MPSYFPASAQIGFARHYTYVTEVFRQVFRAVCFLRNHVFAWSRNRHEMFEMCIVGRVATNVCWMWSGVLMSSVAFALLLFAITRLSVLGWKTNGNLSCVLVCKLDGPLKSRNRKRKYQTIWNIVARFVDELDRNNCPYMFLLFFIYIYIYKLLMNERYILIKLH